MHNRLTHSLEVASVGRSLGTLIGKHICEREIQKSDNTSEQFYRIDLASFDSDAFQAVNRDGYIDLLYSDDAIMNAYCSASSAQAFFDERVRNYASCFEARKARHPEPAEDANDG